MCPLSLENHKLWQTTSCVFFTPSSIIILITEAYDEHPRSIFIIFTKNHINPLKTFFSLFFILYSILVVFFDFLFLFLNRTYNLIRLFVLIFTCWLHNKRFWRNSTWNAHIFFIKISDFLKLHWKNIF